MVDSAGSPDATGVRTYPGGVRLVESGAVATVWLDRPGTRNAQTFATWAGLAEAAASIPSSTQVVLLRGAGPDFSSGLDLRMTRSGGVPDEGSLEELAGLDNDGIEQRIAGFQRGFTVWRALDAVVIAVVQGRAIGAGFQLALAADLRVMAEDAAFVMAEARLGLVPDLGGTGRLIELAGWSAALDLCVTARPVSATEALRLGLANHVAASDDLEATVDRLVAAVTAQQRQVVRSVKRLVADGPMRSVAEQLAAERTTQAPLLRGIGHLR